MKPRRGPFSARRLTIHPNDAARFEGFVDRSGECWRWTGSMFPIRPGKLSYGLFNRRYPVGPVTAHRASYAIANGEVPDGACVLHTCDNPRCVRPDHLYLGTPKDNSRDMRERGRFVGNRGPRKTCRRGHPFVRGNVRLDAKGYQRCRVCDDIAKTAQQVEAVKPIWAWVEQHVRPSLPPSLDDLAALIGERRAFVLANWAGLYHSPMRSLQNIGCLLGVSRERARQLRNSGLMKLGLPESLVRTAPTAHLHDDILFTAAA